MLGAWASGLEGRGDWDWGPVRGSTSDSEVGGTRGWRTVLLGLREKKGTGGGALRVEGAQARLLSLR